MKIVSQIDLFFKTYFLITNHSNVVILLQLQTMQLNVIESHSDKHFPIVLKSHVKWREQKNFYIFSLKYIHNIVLFVLHFNISPI